jgi:hypothetical protein
MVSEFRGPPPHDLGTVEIAVAQAMNENTEITLHIIDAHSNAKRPLIPTDGGQDSN